MSDDSTRYSWGTKAGLILAMAGNAVGFGNFLRFPVQLGKNGGGAFLIPYFLALIILGIPLMWIEWTIGRFGGKYGHGTIAPELYLMAREKIKPRKAIWIASIAGMLVLTVTVLINSYYLHLVGWTMGYTWFSATGAFTPGTDTVAFFTQYIEGIRHPWLMYLFWILSLILLVIPISKGISQGIEKWVEVMMPALYIFGFLLVARTLTIGAPIKPEWSALKGMDFIWKPDFAKLNFTAALAAAGQIFYTLSLGMGLITCYASYLKPDDDLPLSGFTTVSLNELAEVILGGSIVIPVAYAFMGPEIISNGTFGLAFMVLPNIFMKMQLGQLWGTLWFILLFVAGYTSAIALYNYVVSLIEEDIKIKRSIAAWLVFFVYILIGLPVVLEPHLTHSADLLYLTELDNWAGSFILIIVGLIEVVVAVWLFGDKLWEEFTRGAYWSPPKWFFTVFMRYLTPAYIIFLLVGTIRDYYLQGYFTAKVGHWAMSARLVILAVFVIGFIEAYLAIKKKYHRELESNQILIRK
jgi:SNF family Na+-dependent transporter